MKDRILKDSLLYIECTGPRNDIKTDPVHYLRVHDEWPAAFFIEMVENVKLAANKILLKYSHVQIVDSLWLIESRAGVKILRCTTK